MSEATRDRTDRDRFETASAVEAATERLFRLTVNRGLYTSQAAAVGAVVTRAGYALLRTLSEQGSLTAGELARRSHMDPGATARQIKALEIDGLVDTSSAADDARVKVVSLTASGREIVTDIIDVRIDHLVRVLAEWPSDDAAQLAALVDRLVAGLRATPFTPTQRTANEHPA
jgi:DNA-binding MarR family transcriptional regulator